MNLCENDIKKNELWESKGYILPRYDRGLIKDNTCRRPIWLHLGAGNLFRSLAAITQQKLLDEGVQDRGIIVAEGFDHEIVDVAYTPYDNLSVFVVLKADGSIEKTVIASVVEAVKMDDSGLIRLKDIFAADSLSLVTLTITEKGYNLRQGNGEYYSDVSTDLINGPDSAESYMGRLAALCYHRFKSGAAPLALVSMDNCSHNGIRLFEAVHCFAAGWVDNGLVESGFLSYVEDKSRLSFPWTMVDRITPGPDSEVAKLLGKDGVEGMHCIKTAKGTPAAAFVNAEETAYFVIEDAFPNGRPPLEKAGVIITGRETVDKVEKMKVCTCLNPLHTALAVFGCLLSYKRISDEMKDDSLRKLVHRIADEGLPVVIDPGVIVPADFINTVINVRLPNPFMPDTPQRIAADTSQKIPVRFGETIKAYMKNDTLDTATLLAIPLVLAGWLRYLLGIDDNGNAFDISPDPMLSQLKMQLKDINIGQNNDYKNVLSPLLSNAVIFGVDLNEAGLSGRVLEYFSAMTAGKGSVRMTLENILNKE